MTFLLSDVEYTSETSVLELAETVLVEFSKTGESINHQQILSKTEKNYQFQLEGQDQYDLCSFFCLHRADRIKTIT